MKALLAVLLLFCNLAHAQNVSPNLSASGISGTVPNSGLTNSSTTVNGQSCVLGAACTAAAAASTLTGNTLAAGVTASSLTSVGTLSSLTVSGAMKIASTIVGSLPTCNAGAAGTMFLVTDALLPVALAQVAAGGSVVISVICNGTIWIVS